jgi:glycerate 2-kinase
MPAVAHDHSAAADWRAQLLQLFQQFVASANPARCVQPYWPDAPLAQLRILAVGKAALSMAQAACAHYAACEVRGVLSAPHAIEAHPAQHTKLRGAWQCFSAGHPLPNAESEAAARAALSLFEAARPGDLCLALISGGGSALMELAISPLTLSDATALYRALLHSGLSIDRMNQVRAQFSAVKGGRLAALALARGARMHSLIVSDVPGDTAHWVASGPTVAWPVTSLSDELLLHIWPAGKKLHGFAQKPPLLDQKDCTYTIVASPRRSLALVAAAAQDMDVPILNLGSELSGETSLMAQQHAGLVHATLEKHSEFLLLSGGESQVTLNTAPTGRGGRNCEYAAALLQALSTRTDIEIQGLAADSDGIDGTGPAAGARYDCATLARAAAESSALAQALKQHACMDWFTSSEQLITGATGTNVNDFRALWVRRMKGQRHG